MASTYVVKSGDTLSAIAARNGLSVSQLLKYNPTLTTNPKYKNGSVIFSGTTIKLAPPTTKAAAVDVPNLPNIPNLSVSTAEPITPVETMAPQSSVSIPTLAPTQPSDLIEQSVFSSQPMPDYTSFNTTQNAMTPPPIQTIAAPIAANYDPSTVIRTADGSYRYINDPITGQSIPLTTTTGAGLQTYRDANGNLRLMNDLTPPITAGGVTPQLGGSAADQLQYQSDLRTATANLEATKTQAVQEKRNTLIDTETALRKAQREAYQNQVRAQAGLAARGLSGAPGLTVAAKRAAAATPQEAVSSTLLSRQRQLNALDSALSRQLLTYEEQQRLANEKLSKITSTANALTGA
jgi:murein DD-endopeptidase MepM/ murein hydrolase activator NlpD